MWLLCALTQLRELIKSDLNPELKFHVSYVRWGVMWDGICPKEDGHSSHPRSCLKMSDQTRFINRIIPFYLMLCRFYSKILTALLLNSSWYFLLYFDRLLSCAACSVLLALSCELDLVHLCSPGVTSLHTVCVPLCPVLQSPSLLLLCVLCSQYLVVSFGSCHASHSVLWRYVDFRCSLYSH